MQVLGLWEHCMAMAFRWAWKGPEYGCGVFVAPSVRIWGVVEDIYMSR